MDIIDLINQGYIIRKLPTSKTELWIEYKDRPLKEGEVWIKTVYPRHTRYAVKVTKPVNESVAGKYLVTRNTSTGATVQFDIREGIGNTIEEAVAHYKAVTEAEANKPSTRIISQTEVAKYGD